MAILYIKDPKLVARRRHQQKMYERLEQVALHLHEVDNPDDVAAAKEAVIEAGRKLVRTRILNADSDALTRFFNAVNHLEDVERRCGR